MNLRKCKRGEINKIVEVADKSFATDRPKGYTFKNSMAKIYDNKNLDYSESHFVIECDKQIVSLAGNLLNDINVYGNIYKFSRVGTVCTLPEYRNTGCMKKLMGAIDQENIKNNVVFSMLTGSRNRYKHFGYDRAGVTCSYIFTKHQQIYLNGLFDINIKPYKSTDLDEVYKIYLLNQKFIIREKCNFEIHLNNPKYKLYTIFSNNKIVGYFSARLGEIVEIALSSTDYLESVIKNILSKDIVEYNTDSHNEKFLKVFVNLLNKQQCKVLDNIAEYKTASENVSIKVYNLAKFIEMLYLIGKNRENVENLSENYKIAKNVYKFIVNNKKVSVLKTEENYLAEFADQTSFVRYIVSPFDNCNIKSKIFPLIFDLNIADHF